MILSQSGPEHEDCKVNRWLTLTLDPQFVVHLQNKVEAVSFFANTQTADGNLDNTGSQAITQLPFVPASKRAPDQTFQTKNEFLLLS